MTLVKRPIPGAGGACPVCASPIRNGWDAYEGTAGRPIEPLDFLVCCACGICLIVGRDLMLREPTHDELALAGPLVRSRILVAQHAILQRGSAQA